MIGFETRKLFLRRNTIIVILLFILVPFIPNLIAQAYYHEANGIPEKLYNVYKPHEGAIDPLKAEESDALVRQVMKSKLENKAIEYASSQISFSFDYSNSAAALANYKEGSIRENSDKPYSIAGVSRLLERLETNGRQDSYVYKSAKMQLEMLKESGEPGFFYTGAWNHLFSFICGGSFIFVAFMILFVVSPVFSNEYSSGMDSIILSSRNGRSKIVTAKLTAGLIFVLITVFLYNISQSAAFIIAGGVYGWDAPLNSLYMFSFTPYSISILKFFLIQFVYQMLGCVVLMLVVFFISSKFKSSHITFFVGLLAVMYPFIMEILPISNGVFDTVKDLSAIQLVRVQNIFAGYKAFNIFGTPVLYAYVLIPLAVLLGIVMIASTYREIAKKEVY